MCRLMRSAETAVSIPPTGPSPVPRTAPPPRRPPARPRDPPRRGAGPQRRAAAEGAAEHPPIVEQLPSDQPHHARVAAAQMLGAEGRVRQVVAVQETRDLGLLAPLVVEHADLRRGADGEAAPQEPVVEVDVLRAVERAPGPEARVE